MPFSKGLAGSGGPQYSIGADGWTVFSPSKDSRLIYVAASGSSGNDGLTPSTPKQTLAQAYALARDKFPDHIYLNYGDSWTDGWGGANNGFFQRNGRSRNEPIVISAYGNPALGRPKLLCPTLVQGEAFGWTSSNGQNIAIQDLEFYNPYCDPDNVLYSMVSFTGTVTSGSLLITGISDTTGLVVNQYLYGPGVANLQIASIDSATQITVKGGTPAYNASNVELRAQYRTLFLGVNANGNNSLTYIEGCFFNYAGLSINGSNPSYGIEMVIRRNTVAYNYIPGTLCQGMFVTDLPLAMRDSIIEENFFFRNGWHPEVWGTDSLGRNHNAYVHDVHPGHFFRKNITAQPSFHGYMQRNGSISFDNLYVECPSGGTYGAGIRYNNTSVSYNTFLHGCDLKGVSFYPTAASGVGATTLTFATVPTTTAGVLSRPDTGSMSLYNESNPGSLDGRTASSVTGGKTVNLSGAVMAGVRGDGVQIGDRIYNRGAYAQAYNVGGTWAFPIANPAGVAAGGNPGYTTGSTGPFYVAQDKPIPSWVTVGTEVYINHNVGVPFIKFAPGTTVASVADNRLSFTTSSALLSNLSGGVYNNTLASNGFSPQAVAIFSGSGLDVNFPTNRWGPNNIMCNAETSDSTPVALEVSGFYVDASGNYIHNWSSTVSGNILDTGFYNTTTPTLNQYLAGNDLGATLEDYDSSIGGPGTREHFYAGCLAQRRGYWDDDYTAHAVNVFMRAIFGIAEP